MKQIDTGFKGLCLIETPFFSDARGTFQKVFNVSQFAGVDLSFDVKEIYFSVSKKDVIRGMHFQMPPFDHDKLVFLSKGSIVDVVLDLRKREPTYGKHYSVVLKEGDGRFIFIPKGFAHGFLSLEDDTIVNYAQSTIYSSIHDAGISYCSFDFNWGIENPIISERDKLFLPFNEFKSPF